MTITSKQDFNTRSSDFYFIDSISSKYKYNKTKILEINNKTIETPVIWYGLSIYESNEFQLDVFKKCNIKYFLSNAYDLMYQDKFKKREELVRELIRRGLVHKMDSGGFQLMKNSMKKNQSNINLTPESVYRKQCEFNTDVFVELDNPLSPQINEKEQKDLIDKTIDNFFKVYDQSITDKNLVMPVCHGYTKKMIDYCISEYESRMGKIDIIGIGSLVPMVKSIKSTNLIGGKWTFIKILSYLRKRLPDSMIHAFGIGGTMSYLAFYMGIDSLDSNGWIQKSGYGVIQLPGISDRYVVKQESHSRPYLMNNKYYRRTKEYVDEIDIFNKCKCPICSDFSIGKYKNKPKPWKWDQKVKLFDGRSENSRSNRAIHNIGVFEAELELIKEKYRNGRLDDFIESRLRNGNYYKLFLYAKYLKKGYTKKADEILLNNCK